MAIESQTYTLKADEIPLATDGLSQPTFYVDNIRGAIFTPEVVKLNMVEARVEVQNNTVVNTHVCTIIVPKSQVRAWARFLTQLADDNELPPLPAEQIAETNGKR